MARGVCLLVLAAAAALAWSSPASAGPLRTAIFDINAFTNGPHQAVSLARTKVAGATMVRLFLNWREVAPDTRPTGFIPTDPSDPAYRWGPVDQQIRAITEAGLEPIVSVMIAPQWASGVGRHPGIVRPDPDEFAMFARAAATRYSGTFSPDPTGSPKPLPRVRYWQAWNEPNRDYYFMPQFSGGRIVSAGWYRAMVNKFAAAVHAVNPTNLVIAGGLAPLGRRGKPAPKVFMRSFLSAPARFDAWAHHPYTSGGPTHEAPRPNDVSLGDLPEMRAILRRAARSGRVISSNGRVGFWVTEFSWDSNPPDPRALRAALHARWTAEALYRMWRNGVSVVAWFRITDDPLRRSPYQSGFYTAGGRSKLSLRAFRFPVVAFRRSRGVYVWGRTPAGEPDRVVIQIKSGRRWRTLGARRTSEYGIFSKTYRTRIRRGRVRARLSTGEWSLSFSLTPVADRYVNPFGCGGGIPC